MVIILTGNEMQAAFKCCESTAVEGVKSAILTSGVGALKSNQADD